MSFGVRKTVCKKKAKVFSYQLRCNKGSDLRLNLASKAQNEPLSEKRDFGVSDQVRHIPGCAATEDG